MTTKLLIETKESQLKTRLTQSRQKILSLKSNAENIQHSIMILSRKLQSYQTQIEDEQSTFHAIDRQLAYLDGRYQELRAKKHTTKTRKAKPDSSLAEMTSGQLAYLKGALEKLMKEESSHA